MLSGVCGQQNTRIDGGNDDNRHLIIYVNPFYISVTNFRPPFRSLTPRLRILPRFPFPSVLCIEWQEDKSTTSFL